MSEEREAAREAFARLLDAELRDEGSSIEALSRKLPDVGRTTIFSWRKPGGRFPQPATRTGIEDALGWKRDTITRILDRPGEAIFWELADVRAGDPSVTAAVARASELTTDELLIELTRRVGAMEAQLDLYRQPSNVIGIESAPSRNMMDLAALSKDAGRNMEHLEDEDD